METFIPTYLYIKIHTKTRKMYFGKTIKDPINYLGSGKRWLLHIQAHGREYVNTLWYKKFTDQKKLIKYATRFSKQNNIVQSEVWLNLAEETGLDGGPRLNSPFKTLNALTKTTEQKEKIKKGVLNYNSQNTRITIKSKQFTSTKEAAEYFSVTQQTIRNWIAKSNGLCGTITHRKSRKIPHKS